MIPRVSGRNVTAIRPATWNQIAGVVNSAIGAGFHSGPSDSMNGIGGQWLYVKNTGDDRLQFECSGIDLAATAALAIDPAGNRTPVLIAVDEDDEEKPTCVWLEPVKANTIARAVISGLALARVNGSGSDTIAVGREDNELTPDGGDYIRLVMRPTNGLAVIDLSSGGGGGGAGALFITPSGGIPAMVSSGLGYSFGYATCGRLDAGGETTVDDAVVFNSVSVTIPGGKVIQAKRIDGKWFCDVVDCTPDPPPEVPLYYHHEELSDPDSQVAIEIDV